MLFCEPESEWTGRGMMTRSISILAMHFRTLDGVSAKIGAFLVLLTRGVAATTTVDFEKAMNIKV